MTAPISLDHSTSVQQSLVELTRKADQLNIQVDLLKTKSKIQIDTSFAVILRMLKQQIFNLPFYRIFNDIPILLIEGDKLS